MSNHVWRPAWVVLGVVALILTARYFYVPSDFGTHERGFMYGYYRKASEEDWKKIKVKYRTKDYCKDCHADKYEMNMASKHSIIQCENCHGPAMDHPENPQKLAIDKSRDLCIRCHAKLNYPSSRRGELKGIDPDSHNAGMECSACHNPHKPSLEGLK
ncbi:MAG: cytochrome c3 family protein [Nitrospirae bacterium]|nr:cytochrome c3 family protein [Nitrospirota bacterium]